MDIKEISREIYDIACKKGWHDKEVFFGDCTSNIGCEVSEAFEEYRNNRKYNETYYDKDGKPCGIPSEFADIIIRVLDCCIMYDIDIETSLREKIDYNRDKRTYKHGGKIV